LRKNRRLDNNGSTAAAEATQLSPNGHRRIPVALPYARGGFGSYLTKTGKRGHFQFSYEMAVELMQHPGLSAETRIALAISLGCLQDARHPAYVDSEAVDDDKLAEIDVPQLVEATRLSHKTVYAMLARLERSGFLHRVKGDAKHAPRMAIRSGLLSPPVVTSTLTPVGDSTLTDGGEASSRKEHKEVSKKKSRNDDQDSDLSGQGDEATLVTTKTNEQEGEGMRLGAGVSDSPALVASDDAGATDEVESLSIEDMSKVSVTDDVTDASRFLDSLFGSEADAEAACLRAMIEKLDATVVEIGPAKSGDDLSGWRWRLGHELHVHHGRSVDWWQHPDRTDVCAVCHPRPKVLRETQAETAATA
jgi:hypothetical protein